MKSAFIGFRIDDDMSKKITFLKGEQNTTQFISRLINDEYESLKKNTDSLAVTTSRIEEIIRRLENTFENNRQDHDLTRRLDNIITHLETILSISAAVAASLPAATNIVRRKFPRIFEDIL